VLTCDVTLAFWGASCHSLNKASRGSLGCTPSFITYAPPMTMQSPIPAAYSTPSILVSYLSLSCRGPSNASSLGDSHDSIGNSDSTSACSCLSRTREIVRRRRLDSRSSSHLEEGPSDKENSESYGESYSSYTGAGISTLESYSCTTLRTPTKTYSSYEPSIISCDHKDNQSDSRSYVRTKSADGYEKGYERYCEPSAASFVSDTFRLISVTNNVHPP
jgi:hypothetical protein